MIKKLLILCLIAIVPISTYSQNTLEITSEQLRITNLIFAEHKKYSEQIPLLNKQIANLQLINDSWARTDSIKVNKYTSIIQNQNKSIDRLNKKLKRKQEVIKYGGTIGAVTIILCLLIK